MTVAPASLPAATLGAAYNQNITASGGSGPYTFAVTVGSLPAGLSLTSAGVLSGTPTAGGSFNFTVTATDSSTGSGPFTGAMAYTLSVPPVTPAPGTLPAATLGAAYNQNITASGGSGPYTFAVTVGSLPAGLSLTSAGVLSGTPTAGGSFNFTVTATDSSSGSGPFKGAQAYNLTVSAPVITVAPASLPDTTVGAAYNQSISASGGTATYAFAITAGSLPAGLSLSSVGVLSGAPTASGSFTFTVTATDSSTGSGPFSGSQAYTLTVISVVNAPPVVAPLVSDQNPALLNQIVTYNITATDADTAILTYTFNFGDGSLDVTGTFQQGTIVPLSHVYTTYNDGSLVTLTVSDGSTPVTVTTVQTIPRPASGGDGIPNQFLNIPPSTTLPTTRLDGLGVAVTYSDGGVIQLGIDISSLTRSAYTVSTEFSGENGSLGSRTGTAPVIKFVDPGVFVATVSATNSDTHVLAGKARLSLALSNREVGMPVNYTNEPKSHMVKTGKIGGKFSFPKASAASIGKTDLVAYTGSFELPEGLNPASKPELAFSIGNIIDSISIDAKGRGIGASKRGFIKKVRVNYPKLAKGATVTSAGQMATFSVSVSGVDLSSKGFDTEGIQAAVAASEKSLKSVQRTVQVAMVFAGAAYIARVGVNFKLSATAASGTIGGR